MKSFVRAAGVSWLLVAAAAVPARAACTITTTAVAFGTYDVFSATPEDATGTIQIDCNPRENIQVTLSKGSSSTYTTRTLKNGTNALNYNLYRNSARTQIWGDGTGGSSIQSNNNVRTRTYTTYGRAPAAQDASVGAYSDTIIVTVIF